LNSAGRRRYFSFRIGRRGGATGFTTELQNEDSMAHSLSARKRIRQNIKRRALNRWRLRAMRQAIKEFRIKLVHGTIDEATTAFQACSKIVDRTAQRGVIHKNQAARRKSRMSAALKARKVTAAA
jgi:small subunit ribosomal protein S20